MHRSDLGNGESAGSTFIVTDPASTDLASNDLPQTVLLVEDETFVREVACEVLSRAGYRVLKAGNATEALQVFREHAGAVQLLLTDVVLPDRNGCDLASEVALLCRGVRTIFISGYPENAVTQKEFWRFGWSYLPKPFSGASLIEKVTGALQGISM